MGIAVPQWTHQALELYFEVQKVILLLFSWVIVKLPWF